MRRFLLLALALSTAVACGGSVDTEAEQAADTATIEDTAVTDSAPDGGGGTSGPIKCGMETCDGAAQECCVGLSGAKCVAIGGCGGGSAFTCSDRSSCGPSEVCCLVREGTTGTASCKATCEGIVLCAGDEECKDGQRCVNGLGGFKWCRNAGGGDGGGGGWGDGGGGGWGDGGGGGGWGDGGGGGGWGDGGGAG